MEEEYEVIEERDSCIVKGLRSVLLNKVGYVNFEIENKSKKKKKKKKKEEEEEKVVEEEKSSLTISTELEVEEKEEKEEKKEEEEEVEVKKEEEGRKERNQSMAIKGRETKRERRCGIELFDDFPRLDAGGNYVRNKTTVRSCYKFIRSIETGTKKIFYNGTRNGGINDTNRFDCPYSSTISGIIKDNNNINNNINNNNNNNFYFFCGSSYTNGERSTD
ncbi:hypothetical protein M0802_011532 [Mischocyttarus mexicanus]|nr:hypothetical protein M0802_011532 [Mischocyttarus mexicanus]